MNVAQTNLQLYRQMMAMGYRDRDIASVATAYRLAMQMFAGWFRPTDKPFLAHLVGTASVLTGWTAPWSVIATGLLHSAYQFHERRKWSRPIKAALGDEVEALVHGYQVSDWSPEGLRRRIDGAGGWSAAERSLLLIKLADVVDDCADRGLAFAPAKSVPLTDETGLRTCMRLAELLGVSLPSGMPDPGTDRNAGAVPQVVVSTRWKSYRIDDTPGRKGIVARMTRHWPKSIRRSGSK